ncbi:MAG TPA: helix-turn-helix domain-containing protein [Gaiellaceae bacterium]|nr:helix-turn-helix domain-containing protein [Gaiellaceae bacterium]
MFQIGDSLREARTRRGLSAADVHNGIRIRERYLTALEEERWDMLPGEAYTKGFLRTYAEFLGLNGNLYIDEYNARIAHKDDEALVPEALAPKRGPRSSVLRTLVGILVLGAAVAGLAAWRLGGTSNPPHQSQPPASPVSAAVVPAHVVAKHKPRAAATTSAFAVLKATRGRSWLQVRTNGPNGTLLFQGFIEQGATKKFALDSKVWMRLGRPDLLDLNVAGKTVTPHGANPANVILKPLS